MKQILTIALGFFLYLIGTAQNTINYAYDANGNRTSRTIIMYKTLEDKGIFTVTDNHPQQESNALDPSKALYDGLEKARFVIYPNPTSNVVNIKAFDQIEKPITASLLMQDGRTLSSCELKLDNFHSFDLSGYSAGQYILVLTNGTATIFWTIIKN